VVLLPILSVFTSSFVKNDSFSLENYSEIFRGRTLTLLLTSIVMAGIISFISTVIGGVVAFLLAKTDFPFKNPFKIAFLIPLFLSPYILAVSWVDFFIMLDGGKSFIYSLPGVIFVLSLIFSPLSMLVILSGFTNINSQLEEAGLMITTYSKTFIKIILPLVKPSIITSLILVFILAISEFSVPAFLSVNVFVTEIFTQFSAFYRHDIAIANSIVLITICVSLLMFEKIHLANAPFLSISPKAHQIKIKKLKKSKPLIVLILLVYISVPVLIPVVVLLLQAFQSDGVIIIKAFTLLIPIIGDSIFYAALGSILLIFFGFVFAYMSERDNAKPINWILLITFVIPSTVLGIGLIKFFNTPVLNGIYSSFWIIIIGYLGRFIFIAEKLIANTIKQVPRSFEESAQLVGANFLLRLWKIDLPLVFPGIFAAFLIGFLFCLGELGTTIMVYPPGTSVMPIKIYTIMANAPQKLTSAMSLIVLIITFISLAGLFIGHKLIHKRNRIS
jgi:ABC-type Fe3+ transport system permease subunit